MPDWAQHVRPRLSSLRLSPTRENEIVEELSQHLEDRWRELVACRGPNGTWIVRQLLVESMLAAIAGLAGVALAYIGVPALLALSSVKLGENVLRLR